MEPTPAVSPAVWIPALLLVGALVLLLRDDGSSESALAAEVGSSDPDRGVAGGDPTPPMPGAPFGSPGAEVSDPEEEATPTTEPRGPHGEGPTTVPDPAPPIDSDPSPVTTTDPPPPIDSDPSPATTTDPAPPIDSSSSPMTEPDAPLPTTPDPARTPEPEHSDPAETEASTSPSPDEASPDEQSGPVADPGGAEVEPDSAGDQEESVADREPARESEPAPDRPVVDDLPPSGWIEVGAWNRDERVRAFERDRFLEHCGRLLGGSPAGEQVSWCTLDTHRPFVFFAAERPPAQPWHDSLDVAWQRLHSLGVLDGESDSTPIPALVSPRGDDPGRPGDELLPPSLRDFPTVGVEVHRGQRWLSFPPEGADEESLLRLVVHLGLRASLDRQGIVAPTWWQVGLVEWACGVRDGRRWPSARLFAVESCESLLGEGRDWEVWTAPGARRLIRSAGTWTARFWSQGDAHERAVGREWWEAMRSGSALAAGAFFRDRLGFSSAAELDAWWDPAEALAREDG